ncbi:hypothetical protein B0T11DRAFT_355261 [Plectosphaerella cucumerina]|uniref:Uncharacterized protein n=1 Tax=Plectosphaerella cucumerina TaxID=40658 RepID=A0A8K0TCY0_9PEZI|nr:hypothetical protein B0T11DRAFT_355261 [Plectosphaerella cucumerina]
MGAGTLCLLTHAPIKCLAVCLLAPGPTKVAVVLVVDYLAWLPDTVGSRRIRADAVVALQPPAPPLCGRVLDESGGHGGHVRKQPQTEKQPSCVLGEVGRNAGDDCKLWNRPKEWPQAKGAMTNAWRAAPHAGTRQRARKVAEKRKRQMRWSSRSGSWLCIIQREAGNQAHRDLDPGGRDRSRIVVTGPEEREPHGTDDGNEIPKRPPAWPGTGRLFVAHAPQPGCLAVIGSWRAQLASLQVHPPPRGSRLGLS